MPIPPAHHTRFAVRFGIAAHRALNDCDPRQVEIGLMAMRGLDEAGADRRGGRPLILDGVPIVVGSLGERVHVAS